jgi:hypothetical protein
MVGDAVEGRHDLRVGLAPADGAPDRLQLDIEGVPGLYRRVIPIPIAIAIAVIVVVIVIAVVVIVIIVVVVIVVIVIVIVVIVIVIVVIVVDDVILIVLVVFPVVVEVQEILLLLLDIAENGPRAPGLVERDRSDAGDGACRLALDFGRALHLGILGHF